MLPRDLEGAAVRLTVESRLLGTGFFVAPHLVATCAHVVGEATSLTVEGRVSQTGIVIRCERQDSVGDNAFPDVAIIRVATPVSTPLLLDGSCQPGDRLYAWGFPRLAQSGDSVEGECEGFRNFGPLDGQRLIKLKQTQITEGFSGSPVLNLRTGAICGILKRTRDESSPAGGYAVRVGVLFRDPEIAQAQRRIETPLRAQLRDFLDAVIVETEALPTYFPPHLRSVDNIRQRVRVVASSQSFSEVVKRTHVPASGGQDSYDPVHSRPESSAWDTRSIFDRSLDRWDIGRIGAVEWDRLRTDIRFRQLIILGDPGYGKTWLLRYEARTRAMSCKNAFDDDPAELTIPLLVKLQDLAQHVTKTQTLAQTIDLTLESKGLPVEFRRYAAQQFATDRVALLLDAWDEVEQEKRTALRGQVETWIRRYKGPALFTSRFSRFGRFAFGDAPIMELLALERSEITEFAHAWFNATRAQQFLALLRAHPAIGGLARIPLMLALLCRAYDDPTRTLPLRRGELCDRCLRGLLKEWKRDDKAGEVDDLDVEHALSELGRVALALFPRSQFSIAELAGSLGRPYSEARRTIDSLIEDGILIKTSADPDGALAFLHRTFHEFLAARHWASQPWNEALLETRSWDVTWTQVIVFLAGQLQDNVLVVAKLADPERDDAVRSRLALAIRCLEEMPDHQRPRALVDTVTQQALDVWLDHARNGTQDALARLQRAIPSLTGIGGAFRGVPLPVFLAVADPQSFVTVVSALGPDAATPTIVKRLIGLTDRDSAVRRRATEIVARVVRRIPAADVLPALLEASMDEDFERSISALTALANLGEDAATPEVLAFLTNTISGRDGPARWVAPELIASMGKKAVTPDLLAFLVHSLRQRSPGVGDYAATLFAVLGETAATPSVVRSMLEAIRDDPSPVRQRAARALVSMDRSAATPETLGRLIELLTDADSRAAATAGWTLGALGQVASTPEVLDALAQLLRDPRSEIRSVAVYTLGQMGRVAARPDVVDDLTRLTEDDDWMTRWKAAEALGQMGERGVTRALLVRLVGWLRLGDWVVRWKAAETLANFADTGSIAVVLPALNDLMRDPDPEVRGRAASVVGRMRADAGDPETLDRLAALTLDDHVEVQVIALDALSRLAAVIGNPETVLDRLLELSHSDSGKLRCHVVEALSGFAKVKPATGVVQRLMELLSDPAPMVARAAFQGFAGLRDGTATPDFVTALSEMTGSKDDAVSLRAFGAWAEMGAAAAVPTSLEAVLAGTGTVDGTFARTRRAVWLVGRLGPAAASQPVLDRLLIIGQENSDMREAVLETLARLGEPACVPEVLRWLGELLQDLDARTRRTAAKTLGSLQLAGAYLRVRPH